jgi:hypothetical protein
MAFMNQPTPELQRSVSEGPADLAGPLDGARQRVEAIYPIGLSSYEQDAPDEEGLRVDLAVQLRREELPKVR